MNANDYWSTPPPLFLRRYAPYKAPLQQCISIRCPTEGKSNQYWSAS